LKILYTAADNEPEATDEIISLASLLGMNHDVTVAAARTGRLYKAALEVEHIRTIAQDFPPRLRMLLRERGPMRRHLHGQRYDIVHINGVADHRLLAIAARGEVRERTGLVYTLRPGAPMRGVGAALRARFGTDRVICNDAHTLEQARGTLWERKGLRRAHPGVDTAHFSPLGPMVAGAFRQDWLPRAFNRLVLGAFTAERTGWLELTEAVDSLPPVLRQQVQLLVAGPLPDAAQRQRLAGLHIHDQIAFTGPLDDARPFMASLDIGVALHADDASLARCREIMSMGKPVIVSNAGGLPEHVVAGEDGWIVPARWPAEVATLLREILADRDMLPRMGRAARARIEQQFSMNAFAREAEAVYAELVDERMSGGDAT
jgi:glycosyltransferase involved in cell wall biosynthesis